MGGWEGGGNVWYAFLAVKHLGCIMSFVGSWTQKCQQICCISANIFTSQSLPAAWAETLSAVFLLILTRRSSVIKLHKDQTFQLPSFMSAQRAWISNWFSKACFPRISFILYQLYFWCLFPAWLQAVLIEVDPYNSHLKAVMQPYLRTFTYRNMKSDPFFHFELVWVTVFQSKSKLMNLSQSFLPGRTPSYSIFCCRLRTITLASTCEAIW